MLEEARCPPKHLAWSAAPFAIEPVDPLKAYSPLVLPDFNKKEILEGEADEILEKVPEVVGEIGQAAVAIAVVVDCIAVAEGETTTAKNGAVAKETSLNLSPNL